MSNQRVDYDSIAPIYDQRYRSETPLFAQLGARLGDFVGGEGRSVLEVGCGTGHWLELLDRAGARVHGLDASPGMLAGAKTRVPAAELVHGSAEALPWEPRTFDRVICINAIHHFPDKPGFVREAARVLKGGGAAMIVGLDPHRGVDRWWVYQYFERVLPLDQARMPSTGAISEMMQQAGFVGVETTVVNHVPLRVTWDQLVTEGHTHRKAASQLTLVTDDEYARGIAQVEQDIAAAKQRGETLLFDADLTFYATVGTLP